jgi:hypothetical protein
MTRISSVIIVSLLLLSALSVIMLDRKVECFLQPVPVGTLTDDVAVTNVTVTITHCSNETKIGNALWVYQGMPVYINVTVFNNGTSDETVSVALSYSATLGETLISPSQSILITTGDNGTVQFVWDTMGIPCNQKYTLTANATISMDSSPADNNMTAGPLTVRILGDIDGDLKANLKDAYQVALSFEAVSGDELESSQTQTVTARLMCETSLLSA